jgi:hypothetical protein
MPEAIAAPGAAGSSRRLAVRVLRRPLLVAAIFALVSSLAGIHGHTL